MRGMSLDEEGDTGLEAWLERLHPDDLPRILATLHKQDEGQEGHDTLEYRERHRDGHWMWILSRGKPVEWDENGKPTRTVGTDTDITRLKHVEAQLAEEKERFRVTLESIGEGVIAADASGCVQYMNPAAEHLTGWTEEGALGQALWRVFVTKYEATGEMAPDVLGNCLRMGTMSEIDRDVIIVSRDGTGRGVSGT